MTDALLLVLGLGADAHAFLAKVRARHHHAPGRENRTKKAAIASLARMKAEAELASLYRERAIARAWAARRDPN